MARILAYTTPARGHLFPVAPVLQQLRARGHDVALRTLDVEVERMNDLGFATRPIDPALESIALDDFRARTPQAAIKRAMATFARRAPIDAADLRQAIADEQPDALLVDVNAWGATAAAEAWGGPWASWCPYPLPIPSRDAPPFGPGLPPARGRAGRLRDRALSPLLTRGFEKAMLPGANAVRADLGLAPLGSAADALLRADVVLYMTGEPFEYPRSDWPPNVRLIGPCAWEPPSEEADWLARDERPVVLVTTSSEFQDDGRLAAVALEALRDEPVLVVVTVPAQDASSFSAPPNARVESFAAHGPILDRAICAVTHGGMGATQKAIARGVPVCVVPFGRDQLEVARRAATSGAGTRLPARRLRPDRLRAAVREAVQRRDGARRVADAWERTGGSAAGADAVEGLV